MVGVKTLVYFHPPKKISLFRVFCVYIVLVSEEADKLLQIKNSNINLVSDAPIKKELETIQTWVSLCV